MILTSQAGKSLLVLYMLGGVAQLLPAQLRGAQPQTEKQLATATQEAARQTMHHVLRFYREEVGYQGAYLWQYSDDLSLREGEGQATRTSGWTQPPGSPSVGEAYLDAWRLSGDKKCLDAAVEVAHALVRSQLLSGGWSYHFDLSEEGSRRYAYRGSGDAGKRRNYTTFDDNKSQSALTLLMHVDEALGSHDAGSRDAGIHEAGIHEAVEYALSRFMAAQYPNGAWPQQYAAPPNKDDFPIKQASYPASWSRIYEKKDYRGHYTLNDNNMSYIVDMLLEAERIYGRTDVRRAAAKTGDFFLLAQMPDPQPGWAQQYDRDMHPTWARKFEPAGITGGESQSVMKTLIKLYAYTGEGRFVTPLRRAITYYRSSQLPDGRLARFYELHSNRPLYFTKDYQLTYSDADMPTHYSFKTSSKLDAIDRDLRKAIVDSEKGKTPKHALKKPVKSSDSVANRARKVIASLDKKGAWIEEGELRYQDDKAKQVTHVIRMDTFARNLRILAAFVGAQR